MPRKDQPKNPNVDSCSAEEAGLSPPPVFSGMLLDWLDSRSEAVFKILEIWVRTNIGNRKKFAEFVARLNHFKA